MLSNNSCQSSYSRYPFLQTMLAGLSVSALALVFSQSAAAITTKDISYTVDNQPYQGYYAQADRPDAPFILLIHDWDGLTDYEKKRADMLASEGYNVLAADMFGAGIRPTELEDKKRLTSEPTIVVKCGGCLPVL